MKGDLKDFRLRGLRVGDDKGKYHQLPRSLIGYGAGHRSGAWVSPGAAECSPKLAAVVGLTEDVCVWSVWSPAIRGPFQ